VYSTIWSKPSSLIRITDMRVIRLALLLAVPAVLSAQKRAITFDDFINLPVVSDPQLSPAGGWVAYTVTTPSLKENRGIARIWLANLTTGETRQLTQGPGSDRSPRWSPDGKTLAFISSRQGGPQIWVLGLAGGEARKVTSIEDGVGEIYWKPDGGGLLAVVDVKGRPNRDRPAQWRLPDGRPHLDRVVLSALGRFRAGRRQHVFVVDLASGGHRPHAGGSRRADHRHRWRRRRRDRPRRQGDRRRDAW
jgi:dipeptidyl aminopeptidase/acylaminoacyl peptidase